LDAIPNFKFSLNDHWAAFAPFDLRPAASRGKRQFCAASDWVGTKDRPKDANQRCGALTAVTATNITIATIARATIMLLR
jgi:hypothetical protein